MVNVNKLFPRLPIRAKLVIAFSVFGVAPVLLVGGYGAFRSFLLLHNIHTYEIIGKARRTLFNLGQPDQGSRLTKPIKLRRGEWVKVECDAHDFMHAWMFGAASPYAAITGPDGSFTIGDIPPGKYKMRVLHPVLGAQEGEVTIAAKGRVEVTLELKGQ